MSVPQLVRQAGGWFTDQLIVQKLDNPLGYVLMIGMGISVAFLISLLGKFSFLLPVLFVGAPVLFLCLTNFEIGLSVSVVAAFMVGLLVKLSSSVPFGMSLDGMLFLMLFALLLRQIGERNFSFANNKLTPYMLIWVGYCLLNVFNPIAESQLAWVFTVRSVAILSLFFFIGCYAFTSLEIIIRMLKLIIFMTFLSAVYGLKQEFIGFADWEMAWLMADEKRMQLIVQWSRIRVFGFFSDPTNYGMLLSYIATMCFVLMTGPFRILHKIMLGIGALAMLAAMAYGGSRTPFVLLPFGLFIFVLLKMDKRVMLVTILACAVAFGVVMKGHNNAVLFRIQSAFIPKHSEDTMNVRFDSQRKIQPYIQTHPIGAGLGATGVWGKRFSPHTELSSFPPDSGLVRIAVELGWIGLILYSILLFKILQLSVYYYFRARNPKIKVIYLALVTVFFELTLASYPQEAIIILPTSINYYLFLAMLVKLKDFDDPPPTPNRKKSNFGKYAKDFMNEPQETVSA